MITRPTLLLDKQKCLANISTMVNKAKKAGVVLRPHFKTHQSHEIGRWFREIGIDRITCSSLSMANYFAEDGWSDITIAFPVNVLEIETINKLAAKVKLNLLVETVEAVELISGKLTSKINLFIKIDAGYGRTGIDYMNLKKIDNVIEAISRHDYLNFSGFLEHAGHSYNARGQEEIMKVHFETLENMATLKARYMQAFPEPAISIGDTPTCSVAEDFGAADEIRPGNFVFYDLMQEQIGACDYEQIAVIMACPVVALHPERNEIVVYGGGVHFSKDRIVNNGKTVFGKVVENNGAGWGDVIEDTYVKSLSQEHGIIKATDSFLKRKKIGDIVKILPVHSCMAADLMDGYLTTDGEWLEKRVNSLS